MLGFAVILRLSGAKAKDLPPLPVRGLHEVLRFAQDDIWRLLYLDMNIRPMTPEDLPQILAIEEVSFPVPFSENLFHMELNLSVAHMFVGVVDREKIVGYFDFWHIGPEIHLINIAVAPTYRQQGVGGQFMQSMMDFAKKHEVKEFYLDVRESNHKAIQLYERFGFQSMAIRDAYYTDNKENAIVMGLLLGKK